MKTIAVLLAAVGLVASATINPAPSARGVSDIATQAIYDLRDQMPCGFPSLGIPPLAPLKIPYKAVDIELPDFTMKGAVQNFRLNGLNDFDINEMDINVVTSKVNFEFQFNDINLETLYEMRVYLKKAGFTINLVGDGPARFALKDLTIAGNMKYSFSVLNGRMQLKSLAISTHIGEVVSNIKGILGDGNFNERMNTVIEKIVTLVMNDNSEFINQFIETRALPVVNSALEDVSLTEIAANAGEGGERETCIPSK